MLTEEQYESSVDGGFLVPDSFAVDLETMKNARPGDIITLGGRRVRVIKKTNFNMAVEPYTWRDVVGDKVLEFLGRFLP